MVSNVHSLPLQLSTIWQGAITVPLQTIHTPWYTRVVTPRLLIAIDGRPSLGIYSDSWPSPWFISGVLVYFNALSISLKPGPYNTPALHVVLTCVVICINSPLFRSFLLCLSGQKDIVVMWTGSLWDTGIIQMMCTYMDDTRGSRVSIVM